MHFRLIHFTGWFTLFFLVLQFGSDIRYSVFETELQWWFNSNPIIVISGFLAFYLQALIVYFILFHGYEKRGLLLISLILIAALPFLISMRFGIQEVITDAFFGIRNYNPETSLSYYFLDNIYFTFLFSSFSVFYFFHRYSKHKHQMQLELAFLNNKSELEFLKSQVNPHFLFNNLNSIYSLVNTQSNKKALLAIEHLSELLRYGLYENAELVPLRKELEMMNRYIALQQLRHDYPINIKIKIDENLERFKVIPLSITSILENAFKHGVYRLPDEELVISLESKFGNLNILVSNATESIEHNDSKGLGLENLKRRLQLIFPDKHELSITRVENRYIVNLLLKE